jgi:hypothetical protein
MQVDFVQLFSQEEIQKRYFYRVNVESHKAGVQANSKVGNCCLPIVTTALLLAKTVHSACFTSY